MGEGLPSSAFANDAVMAEWEWRYRVNSRTADSSSGKIAAY